MTLKKIICLSFILIGFNSHLKGQVNTGNLVINSQIKDSKTASQIPFVNIYILDTHLGTSANAEGEFSIQINQLYFSDTLVFSAIGYKTLKLPISSYLANPNQEIFLEENILELKEVSVSPVEAVEIVRKAMNAKKFNYGISPHKLAGIYRISDQEDGAHVRLLEAAVNIYDANYMKKNNRIVDYLALRQSKDFRTFKWKVDKFNKRNVDELLKPDLIKRPTRATHPNGFEKGFFYELEKYALINNEQVYVISATKNTAYEWPNYNAIFYIRVSDLAILQVERDYKIGRKNWAKAPNVATHITKDKLVLKYKELNGKLYLNYFLWNLKGNVRTVKSDEKVISFERNEELNIHSISLEKMNTKPTIWDGDIYEMVGEYNQAFWDDYPIANTQLFKEVKKELMEKQNLNEQFLSSENKFTPYNPNKAYKAKALKEDLNLLRNSLEEAHPALYRYTTATKFSRDFDSLFQSISKPLTELEFYRLLTPLIAQINCGHTQSKLSDTYYKFYNHRNFFFPLQTKYTNGKLIISESYFLEDPIMKGSQIIAVNGEDISIIKKNIDKHLSSDGFIQSSKNQLFGDSFSSLYSIYQAHQDTFLVKIQSISGEVFTKKMNGISLTDFYSKNEKKDNSNKYSPINKNTSLLRISSFTDSQQQGFKEWIKNTFINITENNVQNLILDLRDNEGGRDDYAIYLYSFLANSPFSYHRFLESASNHFSFLSFTDQDSSLNKFMSKIVKKDKNGRFLLNESHPTLGTHKNNSPIFNGKVLFLINGNTFSAAADFAAIARENQRGIFIGEETGGTALGNTSNGMVILTLPNTGISIKIPLFKVVNAVSTSEIGRGVIPDYTVIYDPNDVVKTKDKELDLALEILGKK